MGEDRHRTVAVVCAVSLRDGRLVPQTLYREQAASADRKKLSVDNETQQGGGLLDDATLRTDGTHR
jgi:hypothetical protein